MNQRKRVDVLGRDDGVIQLAAEDPYVKFVSSQVMHGIVEHTEAPSDWIEPRMGHIQGKFKLPQALAYQALRQSEEMADAH